MGIKHAERNQRMFRIPSLGDVLNDDGAGRRVGAPGQRLEAEVGHFSVHDLDQPGDGPAPEAVRDPPTSR